MEPLLLIALYTAQVLPGSGFRQPLPPTAHPVVQQQVAPRPRVPRVGLGWLPWSGGAGVTHRETIVVPADPPPTEKQRIEGLIVSSPLYQVDKPQPSIKEYPNLPPPVTASPAPQTPRAESK